MRVQITVLKRAFIAVVHCLLVGAPFSAKATSPQSAEPDMLVLSLGTLDNATEDHRAHIRERLTNDPDLAVDLDKRLLEIQMEIARKTAPFGPVLLVAPDEATKNAIYARCAEFQICDLIRQDNMRLKVVEHTGVWVRDYGPHVQLVNGAARVTHWRYFDNRSEEGKNQDIKQLNMYLLSLIETRLRLINPDGLLDESSDFSLGNAVAELDSQINLVRELTQTLSEMSPQRNEDDSSAFDIADAALASPGFSYATSKVALDGGNLLKLEGDRCLTTRALLSRNKDQQVDVYKELRDVEGCKEVVFLDPLPGPVIEHIDMFALPLGPKKLLLASYDLTDPLVHAHWRELSDPERFMMFGAALAMDRNADRLKQLGYEVIRVPSPAPRIPRHGDPYYPTVLNAVVRTNRDNHHQLLVPFYKGYQEDIQAAARSVIKSAYGRDADVVTIESSEAAKAQGAIHCLTLTIPLEISIFGDRAEAERRGQYLAQKEKLDRDIATEIAARIPPTGVDGVWAILDEEDQQFSADITDPSPMRIYFGRGRLELGSLNTRLMSGTYEVENENLDSWSLRIKFEDDDEKAAALKWMGKDEATLQLGDEDTWVLKRLNYGAASPFEDTIVGEAVAPETLKGSRIQESAPHHRRTGTVK